MSAHSGPVAAFRGCSSTEPEQQYGVLPWRKDRRGGVQILLITSRSRGRWIVPKGWPIRDRAPYLAAAMEAFEEAGVIGEVLSHPLASYDYVKEGEGDVRQHRRVTLFSFRVVGTLTNWPERGQRKRRWFSLVEARDRADDPGLAEIIGAIHEELELFGKKEGQVVSTGSRLDAALPS